MQVDKSFADKMTEAVTAAESEVVSENTSTLPVPQAFSAGSLGAITVKSEAYRKWIANVQEWNPLVGKHCESAPEFRVADVEVDAPTEVSVKDMQTAVQMIESQADVAESTTSTETNNFLDFNIVENSVKENKGVIDLAVLETAAQKALVDYHGDSAYVPEFDIAPVVSDSLIRRLAFESMEPIIKQLDA
jgi:hypothetical protein